MTAKGKPSPKVFLATARELIEYLWTVLCPAAAFGLLSTADPYQRSKQIFRVMVIPEAAKRTK